MADLLLEVIKLDLPAKEQSGRLLSKAVRRCKHIYNSELVLENGEGEALKKEE